MNLFYDLASTLNGLLEQVWDCSGKLRINAVLQLPTVKYCFIGGFYRRRKKNLGGGVERTLPPKSSAYVKFLDIQWKPVFKIGRVTPFRIYSMYTTDLMQTCVLLRGINQSLSY